jgi:hypothetical protein
MEDVIVNRFDSVLGEWVALHDEDKHFKGFDPTFPHIKLCGLTLRVRANDAWSKLPKHLKEAMVAHELGHREMNHAANPQDNPFFRMGFVLRAAVDPRELEADRYACKLVTRLGMLKALKELSLNATGLTLTEYKLRIKALERVD